MNKKKIAMIAGAAVVVLAAAGIAAVLLLGGGSEDKPALGARADKITDKDFLSVSGSSLVNRSGERVVLRGVNLGSWMLQECWMSPVVGIDGEWGNLDTIEAFKANGMSDEQIQRLFDSYQDNWITEYDLDIIAESGVNCIRVPFWYRNFMLDEAGTWIDDDLDRNPGFERLDWVIKEAGKRGLYVILDLHGAPGGQSMNHSTGTVGRNDLYTSEECRATMKKLWVAIAERYKGNATVAAYDLMNEPQNNDAAFSEHPNYIDAWDSKSWEQTNDVYREMVAAVREVDPDHVISVEGIWRISNLPDPAKEGWTNMLYQVHLYDATAQFRELAEDIAKYGEKHGVAVYVGEFSNMEGIAICEEHGISWTTWTYKGGKGSNGTWFWYYANPDPVVPTKDDFETALAKWGESLRTENGFWQSAIVYNNVYRAVNPSEEPTAE